MSCCHTPLLMQMQERASIWLTNLCNSKMLIQIKSKILPNSFQFQIYNCNWRYQKYCCAEKRLRNSHRKANYLTIVNRYDSNFSYSIPSQFHVFLRPILLYVCSQFLISINYFPVTFDSIFPEQSYEGGIKGPKP